MIPIDLSRFHAFLDPRLTADAMIQGTLDEQLRQIQEMIAEAHEKGLPKITIDAPGMDRALISKVLEKTSPYVTSVLIKETQLEITLKSGKATEEASYRTLTYLHETTVAAWPLASPDESDPFAQGRHLKVLEKLLSEIWKAAQEQKKSFHFQSVGYDRGLLARATLLILPPNTVSFEKVTETSMPGFIKVVIHSAGMENFDMVLPFVQPSSRIEDPNAAPVFRRSRYTSSNQQISPTAEESAPSKISPEILQLIEAYIYSWLEKENRVSLAEDFNTDPLLLQHFRLGFESAMASPDVTDGEIGLLKKILRELKTVEGALSNIERFEVSRREIFENAVGADLLSHFVQALKEVNPQAAQESASIRKEIEVRTYKIPTKFFTNRPPIANIEVEQVDRSYWPLRGGNPTAYVRVDHTPIMSHPLLTNTDNGQKRNLFYKNLSQKLAPLSKIEVDFHNLLQSLEDLKNRDFNPQETQLLALLRAGSASAFGHVDTYLRTHIFEKLPKEHAIKPVLSGTIANIVTFSFPTPQSCHVTRKALYALMGPKNVRVATFILQSNTSVSLTPPIKFEITVSLPVFDAEGQKTFEERTELYSKVKKTMAKSSE